MEIINGITLVLSATELEELRREIGDLPLPLTAPETYPFLYAFWEMLRDS